MLNFINDSVSLHDMFYLCNDKPQSFLRVYNFKKPILFMEICNETFDGKNLGLNSFDHIVSAHSVSA